MFLIKYFEMKDLDLMDAILGIKKLTFQMNFLNPISLCGENA